MPIRNIHIKHEARSRRPPPSHCVMKQISREAEKDTRVSCHAEENLFVILIRVRV